MTVVFMLGGAATTFLGGIFGAHTEAATLALIGLGLAGSGQLLGTMPQKQGKLVTKASEAAR
jgi:hypothetical protein